MLCHSLHSTLLLVTLVHSLFQRNPDIRLYGLPWVWPGWLGGSDFDPFSNITNTVTYVTDWIQGAKKVHNLTVDYIGVSDTCQKEKLVK